MLIKRVIIPEKKVAEENGNYKLREPKINSMQRFKKSYL